MTALHQTLTSARCMAEYRQALGSFSRVHGSEDAIWREGLLARCGRWLQDTGERGTMFLF